jgi:hypothetical protein
MRQAAQQPGEVKDAAALRFIGCWKRNPARWCAPSKCYWVRELSSGAMRNLLCTFEFPSEADARAAAQELTDVGYKTSVFHSTQTPQFPSALDFMNTPSWVLVAEKMRAEEDDTYTEILAARHVGRLEGFGPP